MEMCGKGENQEFVYVGRGLPEDFENIDVEGKVVVASIVLPDYPPTSMIDWFDDKVVYDPNNLITDDKRKSDIYSPAEWPNNYFIVQTKGAVGFVGILENYMDDPYFYNEDYTENGHPFGCEYMKMPGLWVGRSSVGGYDIGSFTS